MLRQAGADGKVDKQEARQLKGVLSVVKGIEDRAYKEEQDRLKHERQIEGFREKSDYQLEQWGKKETRKSKEHDRRQEAKQKILDSKSDKEKEILSKSSLDTVAQAVTGIRSLAKLKQFVVQNMDEFGPVSGRMAWLGGKFGGEFAARWNSFKTIAAKMAGRYLEGGKMAEGDQIAMEAAQGTLTTTPEAILAYVDDMVEAIMSQEKDVLDYLKNDFKVDPWPQKLEEAANQAYRIGGTAPAPKTGLGQNKPVGEVKF